MRVLLALDSRVANRGGFLWIDLSEQEFQFEEIAFDQDFKRLGFRGFCINADTVYAVNSAALYLFRVDTRRTSRAPRLRHVKTLRRPEWEVGTRAAADLHHVYFSAARGRVFVANSFMDCIDEVTPDGRWLGRKYLWDISPDVMELARCRKNGVADLVHVNHVTEYRGRIYLTLGNLNGTREGCVVCYDTGEIVLDGLKFPHDGLVAERGLYIVNSDTSELCIYDDIGEYELLNRRPDHVVPLTIRSPEWQHGGQWARGVALSDHYLVVGSTQLRADLEEPTAALVPPRLIFIDRDTKTVVGDVFLPELEGFPNPCIYTIHCLEPAEDREVSFSSWPPPRAADDETSWMEIAIPDPALRVADSDGGLREWQWNRTDGRVRTRFGADGAEFVLEFDSADDRQYLLSGQGSRRFDDPASDWESYRLGSDTETAVSVDVSSVSSSAAVCLYVMQYDGVRRIATKSLTLREGRNVLRFKTDAATCSHRIALRLSGTGHVRPGRIRISQRQARCERNQRSDAAES